MDSFNLFWLFFPLILFFKSDNDTKKGIVLLLFLIVFLGLRQYNGLLNDTHNYYTIFKFGIEYIRRNPMELLYTILDIAVIKSCADFQWVLMIMAIISVSSVYIACRIAKINPYVGLIMYVLLTYYFYTFNAMRQMTADSILLIGYALLSLNNLSKQKQLLYFIGIVVFASLFHKSAIFALIIGVIYFSNYRVPYKLFVILAIGSLFIGVLPLAKSIVLKITVLLDMYGVGEKYGFNSSVSLSKIAMTIFYIYLYKRTNQNSIWMQTVAIGLVLFNFLAFNPATMRMAYTFLICQTLLMSEIEAVKSLKFDELMIKRICIGYCIFIYYYFYSNNISGIQNYEMNPITKLLS